MFERLKRFVNSGNATLFSACAGAFCGTSLLIGHHVDRVWPLPMQYFGFPGLIMAFTIPVTFMLAVATAIGVLAEEPYLRQPREVSRRLILAAIIMALTVFSFWLEEKSISARLEAL
jgi:uncharacterized RDD family membrane protein YckC